MGGGRFSRLAVKQDGPFFYQLEIRTVDPINFKKAISWIREKIEEGEDCGFGEGCMWEIVRKERKNGEEGKRKQENRERENEG